MLELREAHQIDILADFVYPRHDTFANGWIGADAEKSLLALSYPDRVAWRQSEGLYLVRDPRAELETRAHLVPWREVAAMRQAAQHNDGFLPFDALLKLADWSAPQVVGLALEFPNLGEISHWKPILQFVNGLTPASRARLQSERGLPWNDAGQTSKRLLLEGAEGDLRAALDRHLLPQPQNVSLRLIRAGQAAAPRQRPGVPRQEARVRITMTLQASIAGEETSRPLGGLLRLPEWKPLSPW